MGMWIGAGAMGSGGTDAGAVIIIPFVVTVVYWIYKIVAHFRGK